MEGSGRYDKINEKVKKLTSKKTSGHEIAVEDKDELKKTLRPQRSKRTMKRVCGSSISEIISVL